VKTTAMPRRGRGDERGNFAPRPPPPPGHAGRAARQGSLYVPARHERVKPVIPPLPSTGRHLDLRRGGVKGAALDGEDVSMTVCSWPRPPRTATERMP